MLPLSLVFYQAAATSGGQENAIALAKCDANSWGMRWAHVSSPNIPANSSFVVVDPKTGMPTAQCMNVEAWGRSAGDKVWATTCHVEDKPKVLNRVWQVFPNGSVVNPVSHLCLDVKRDAGYPVEIGDATCLMSCTANNASKLKYDEETQHITHVASGLCIAAAPVPPTPPTPAPVPRTVNVTVSIDGSSPLSHSADGCL